MRIILFLSIFLAAEARGDAVRRLSLEDIKKFAIANNFRIKAADAEIQENKARTEQRKAALYPRFSLVLGPEIRQQENLDNSVAMAYGEGTWNLFRGSQDRIEIELSQLAEGIAESAKRRAQFELELEIESLFYLHLNVTTKIKFYEESLELNEKHRQMMKRKQSSGLASQADLMEFALRESYLRSEISSLIQQREEARLGMVRLMGPNVGSNFQPYGTVPHVHLKQPLNQFLDRVNSTSEGVKAASLLAASGAIAVKGSRSGWMPRIDATARYGSLSQDIAQTAPALDASLVLRWEFFSGFETRAKIAEAQARADRLDNEFKQKLLSTMTEAEVSYLKLGSIQERVHVEEGNEERANGYYRAVLDEYRRGLKNGYDLKNAEQYLLEAKVRAADFTYSFISTKNRLERDVGIFIETQPHSAAAVNTVPERKSS
jgi:multidrug efflux system outer membrane protein